MTTSHLYEVEIKGFDEAALRKALELPRMGQLSPLEVVEYVVRKMLRADVRSKVIDAFLYSRAPEEVPGRRTMNHRFRKKPVVIEAFRMTRERRWDRSEWPDWLMQAWGREPGENSVWIDHDAPVGPADESSGLVCGTLEGVHRISWNDWIIRGVKDEIYPVKPDVFEATYEKVP